MKQKLWKERYHHNNTDLIDFYYDIDSRVLQYQVCLFSNKNKLGHHKKQQRKTTTHKEKMAINNNIKEKKKEDNNYHKERVLQHQTHPFSNTSKLSHHKKRQRNTSTHTELKMVINNNIKEKKMTTTTIRNMFCSIKHIRFETKIMERKIPSQQHRSD